MVSIFKLFILVVGSNLESQENHALRYRLTYNENRTKFIISKKIIKIPKVESKQRSEIELNVNLHLSVICNKIQILIARIKFYKANDHDMILALRNRYFQSANLIRHRCLMRLRLIQLIFPFYMHGNRDHETSSNRGRFERFTTQLSKPDLDRLLNKALQAPSVGGGCVIPITVPYQAHKSMQQK